MVCKSKSVKIGFQPQKIKKYNLQKCTPLSSISNRFRDMNNCVNSLFLYLVKITLVHPFCLKTNLLLRRGFVVTPNFFLLLKFQKTQLQKCLKYSRNILKQNEFLRKKLVSQKKIIPRKILRGGGIKKKYHRHNGVSVE